jgi:hypothetical protein
VVTLYVKPFHLISGVKLALEKMLGTPTRDQLLLDGEGKLLQDHLTLEYYKFHQSERPIFFMHWPLLESGLSFNFPQYKFKYDIPHPNAMLSPDLEIPIGTVTPLNRLSIVLENWREKGNFVKNLYKNIKARRMNIMTSNTQHEYQHDVYKVLRSHVIRVGSDLLQVFQPVEDLFVNYKTTLEPLLKSYENSINELRKTPVHEALRPFTTATNLLELLDEKKLRDLHKRLEEDFHSLSSNMASAREAVKRINEEVDSVVRTKLDDSAVTLLKNTKDMVSENASKAKGYVNSYLDHLKQVSRTVTDIRQNPKRTDAEIEQALKSGHYLEFPKIIAAIKMEDDNSTKILKSCEEAKIKATRAMVGNLHTIGRVLLDVEHTQNMIKFLQTGVLQSQPQIQELKKITKLQSTYKESLKEIQRRKAYSQKIDSLYKHHDKFFKTLQNDEITKRLAFQANYGQYLLPQLVPFLVKTEQDERNVPAVQLSLRPFDQDIPDIGQLPVSLEDDFSLISDYESNPKDALKRKEEENAQLLEQIQVLLKQTEEKSLPRFY